MTHAFTSTATATGAVYGSDPPQPPRGAAPVEAGLGTKAGTWVGYFPWLRGLAVAAQPWIYQPVLATAAADRLEHVATIAALARKQLPHWSIGQLFAGLDATINLLALANLGTRATNALRARNITTVGQLAPITVAQLLGWRNVGVGTVDGLLQQLTQLHATLTVPTQPVTTSAASHSGGAEATGVSADPARPQARLPQFVTTLAHDLATVAAWQVFTGTTSTAVIDAFVPPAAPQPVRHAHARLQSLRATEVLSVPEQEADLAAVLDEIISGLDERSRAIITDRWLAQPAATLEQLGQRFGITRERIRQLETRLVTHLTTTVSADPQLAAVCAIIDQQITTITPLAALTDQLPVLAAEVSSLGVPVWRVLARLGEGYEVADGWAARPSIAAATAATRAWLQDHVDPHGVVELAQADVEGLFGAPTDPAVAQRWFTHLGYVLADGRVLACTSTVEDYAVALLAINGRPMTSPQILAQFQYERSINSVRNSLSQDPRAVRVDRDTWGLAEWGLETYDSISTKIAEYLEAAGGSLPLRELAGRISTNFDVAYTSVVAFAGDYPFQTEGGIVTFATAPKMARRSPADTARMFRRNDAWVLRVEVDADHLRGSGSPAPEAVATLLGLCSGQTVTLSSRLGPQAVQWTGFTPTFGTIRRFLHDQHIGEGDQVFLVITDAGDFDVEPVGALSGDPIADALRLVGAAGSVEGLGGDLAGGGAGVGAGAGAGAPLDLSVVRERLAAAIDLPTHTPLPEVIAAYRARGDDDVAGLVQGVVSASRGEAAGTGSD